MAGIFGTLWILNSNAGGTCSSCGGTKVKVTFLSRADGQHIVTLAGATATGDSGAPFTGSDLDYDEVNDAGYSNSNSAIAELEIDKEYTLSASGDVGCYHIDLATSGCYSVKINGAEKSEVDKVTATGPGGIGAFADTYTVVVSSNAGADETSESGTFGDGTGNIDGGAHYDWSLGGVANGMAPGRLRLKGGSLAAESYTPSGLANTVFGQQIDVVRVTAGGQPGGNGANVLRQLRSPDGLVDIVAITDHAYEIRFVASPNVGMKTDGLYPVSGEPFVRWRVELPPGGISGQDLRVSETRGEITRVNSFSFDPGSHTWMQTTNGSTTETRTESQLVNGDTATLITVSDATSGDILSQSKETVHSFPWGTEIVERVNDPNAAALATTYEYYTDPSDPGNYSRLKTVIYPGGRWERNEYYNDNDPTVHEASVGVLKRKFQPWKDEPASPNAANVLNSRVTEYAYQLGNPADPGMPSLRTAIAEQREYVLGVMVARSTYTLENGGSRTIATTWSTAWDATSQMEESFSGAAPWPSSGRPSFTKMAEKQEVTYWYQRGTINPVTREFDFNGTGLAVKTGYKTVSLVDEHQINTFRTTVVDETGRRSYEESFIYDPVPDDYMLISRTDYYYDALNLQRVETNGRVVKELSWDGNRLLSESDETGDLTTYGDFDAAGRARSITCGGITTTTVFDALGRARLMTRTGEGLTVTSSNEYDGAGRIKSQTDENGLTTKYLYSSDARTTTVVHPNLSSTITSTYLDGQTKSVTGSAEVERFYDYTVDTGLGLSQGFRHTTVHEGAVNSARWSETVVDWAGRTTSSRRPGQTVDFVQNYLYDSETGQLICATAPGSAPRIYIYGSLGTILRKGLDLSGDGKLTTGSTDRLEESYTYYENTGVGYDEVSVRRGFLTPDNSTPTVLQTTRRRMTGLDAATLSDVTVVDQANNVIRTIERVDRATATVTRTTTTTGAASGATVEISVHGRLMSRTIPTIITPETFEYDGLGRLWKTTDPRNGSVPEITTYHPGTNQIASMTVQSGTTMYEWYPDGQPNAGLLRTQTGPGGLVTRYAYNSRGQRTRVWGGGAQPTETTYNDLAEMIEQRTFRTEQGWNGAEWPTGASGGDVTQWGYHPGSGALVSKTDADHKTVSYSRVFSETGSVAKRVWARKVDGSELKTTYTYNLAGDLVSIDYSDQTLDVSYTWHRDGKLESVTDAAGKATSPQAAPNGGGSWLQQVRYGGSGLLSGLQVVRSERDADRPLSVTASLFGTTLLTNSYEWQPNGDIFRARQSGTPSGRPSPWNGTGYVWERNLGYGRVSKISDGWVRGAGVTYGLARVFEYDAAGRVDKLWYGSDPLIGGQPSPRLQGWDYDWDDANGAPGRRKTVSAYLPARYQAPAAERPPGWTYGYDARGEVELADRFTAAGGPEDGIISHQRRGYVYDPIGNRSSATQGTTTAEEAIATGYTANALNQYDGVTRTRRLEITGQAVAGAGVSLRIDGGSAVTVDRSLPENQTGDPGSFRYVCTVAGTDARWLNVEITATAGAAHVVRSGFVFVPPASFTPVHDADGNLTSDAQWDYTWDAENRLGTATQKVIPAAAGFTPPARMRLVFAYDAQSRRIAKSVYEWRSVNGAGETWVLTRDLRFVYDGWNMIAELDHTSAGGTGLAGSQVLRRYLWGPDVSGTMTGAGGVGGLLSMTAGGTTYHVCSDLNGNVTGLVPAGGTDAGTLLPYSRYDYDPFGNRITNTGPEAPLCPFGFSTKYTDEETGLVYYGFRYYSPELGRWLSRDPMFEIIGEMPELLPEGANVYSFVGNNPINWFDDLGLAAKEAYKIAFKGAGGVDPNGEWASFTSNVFGSTSLNSGVKAAVKYFDTDNNGKLDTSDCPPFKIRVVGYSWGGWTAIKFANEMGNKVADPNKNLKMAVGTLDPVDTLRSGSASIPAWVKSATNIYQTNGCWKGCPGARAGLRKAYAGQSVSGASNTDLTSTPHGQPGYKTTQQNYDHITIQVKAANIVRAVNNAKLD